MDEAVAASVTLSTSLLCFAFSSLITPRASVLALFFLAAIEGNFVFVFPRATCFSLPRLRLEMRKRPSLPPPRERLLSMTVIVRVATPCV